MKAKKVKKRKYNVAAVELSANSAATVNWAANVGFGSFVINKCQESGKTLVDSEYMSRDFIKAALCKMIDDAVFTDFEELTKTEQELTLQELNAHNICGALAKNEKEFNTINYPELHQEGDEYFLVDKNPAKGHTIKVWLSAEFNHRLANSENCDAYLELVERACEIGFSANEVTKAVKTSFTIVSKD